MATAILADYASLAETFIEKIEVGAKRDFDPTLTMWSFATIAAVLLIKLDDRSVVSEGSVSSSARNIGTTSFECFLGYFQARTHVDAHLNRLGLGSSYDRFIRCSFEVCDQFKAEPDVDLDCLANAVWSTEIREICEAEADALRMGMVCDMALNLLIWRGPSSTYEYAVVAAEASHA